MDRRDAENAERKEVHSELNELSGAVIAAAIEVHRILGPGYAESVYEEALCIELGLRGIPFERQKWFDLQYKGLPVGKGRMDLLVDQRLIVDLKVVSESNGIHLAQVLSYIKATNLELGLIINFNVTLLRDGIKRVAKSPSLRKEEFQP